MVEQFQISIAVDGRGFTEVTRQINEHVLDSGITTGLVHVFCQHTSASVIITENADPAVRHDLQNWFARLVSDGDALFTHRSEGPDDMSAHIRSLLAGVEVRVPIQTGRLALGTWQGIFLWEHRAGPQQRQLVITIDGE